MRRHAGLGHGGVSMFLLPVVCLWFLGEREIESAEVKAWTGIGPQGAQVTSLAIDPTSPIIIYAASRGGGVVKTTDGGGNWSSVNGGLTDKNVSVLAVDPLTPTT